MSNFEIAMRRVQQGHRLKFFQDFYGKQLVRVIGGPYFWRTKTFALRNEEVAELKAAIAKRRAALGYRLEAGARTSEADTF